MSVARPSDPAKVRAWIAASVAVEARGYSTPCWCWTANKLNEKGYARIEYRGRTTPAHRLSYEVHVGPIPTGLVIDHLCRNPCCVNPDHLEPVTVGENTRRGIGPAILAARQLTKTTCPKGHAYADHAMIRSNGARQCKICSREWSRRFREKKRAEVASPKAEPRP